MCSRGRVDLPVNAGGAAEMERRDPRVEGR
jgi:hypothetical protein